MKYMLLVHSDQDRWDELPAAGADEQMAEHAVLIDELARAGRLVGCSPLTEPAPKTTLLFGDAKEPLTKLVAALKAL